MIFNPAIHHRRSIRLRGYDYSQAGAYFVTICTQDRTCLFGEPVDGEMQLNDAGKMIERWYVELENKFPDIQCDAFVCMPNHVHFIVVAVGSDVVADTPWANTQVRPYGDGGECVGADLRVCPTNLRVCPTDQGEHIGSPLHGSPLPGVVQWFKTMTTNEYIRGVKNQQWSPFNKKLWQRNYWEHVIRDAVSLNHIRQYIMDNPVHWTTDSLHPAHHTKE